MFISCWSQVAISSGSSAFTTPDYTEARNRIFQLGKNVKSRGEPENTNGASLESEV